MIRRIWQKFWKWYWIDPMAAERRRIECDVRRFNGSVTWHD